MAKHCGYCHGRGYVTYAYQSVGKCRPCGGKVTRGKPEKQYLPVPPMQKKPMPPVAERRRLAKEAMDRVADLFKLIDSGQLQLAAGATIGDFYRVIGIGLSNAVVDAVFTRAIERARSLIPAQYHADFERGLEDGVKAMSERYEGIVWAGR